MMYINLLFLFCIIFLNSLYANPRLEADSKSSAPYIVNSNGNHVGILLGTTLTSDPKGNIQKGYEIYTVQGYLLVILPNGTIGNNFKTLYFSEADCKGESFVPVFSKSNSVDVYAPKQILSFGSENNLYLIPENNIAKRRFAKSKMIHTDNDANKYKCENIYESLTSYLLVQNNREVTGVNASDFNNYTFKTTNEVREVDRSDIRTGKLFKPEVANMPPIDFDAGCAPGCEQSMISDGLCDDECLVQSCGYDANDCTEAEVEKAKIRESKRCSPHCDSYNLGDGFCDRSCNNPQCNFDNGDC